MGKKKSDKKYTYYAVQRNYQFETHDADGNQTSNISENEWRKQIQTEIRGFMDNGISKVFYIFHDKDVNDDGTSKGLHVHLVATSFHINRRTQKEAVGFFGASSLQNCEPCDSYVDSVRYLMHISEKALNEMKTLYHAEEVHGYTHDNDGKVVPTTMQDLKEAMARSSDKKARKDKEKAEENILRDVTNGELSLSSAREVFLNDDYSVGHTVRDYIKFRPSLEAAETTYFERLVDFYKSHDCPKTLIYITGEGGSGKTTLAENLAKHWADDRGVHYVSVKGKSTTYDPAGNYCGQRVSVFNEFSTTFAVEQFCDVFDPMRGVNMSSRFRDKYYFANYCLFTSSVPLEVFIYQLFKNYAQQKAVIPVNVRSALRNEEDWLKAYLRYLPPGDDKIRQIRRRFAIMVRIQNGFASIYCLDHSANVNQSFAFTQFNQIPNSPYSRFGNSVPYDVSNSATIAKQTDFLIKRINDAINFFYVANGYVHPDKYEKPDFTEGNKK